GTSYKLAPAVKDQGTFTNLRRQWRYYEAHLQWRHKLQTCASIGVVNYEDRKSYKKCYTRPLTPCRGALPPAGSIVENIPIFYSSSFEDFNLSKSSSTLYI